MKSFCYYKNCQNITNSREHAPPKCFFPQDMRKNLISVPSCNEHNSEKNGEDEYVRNVFCFSIKSNQIGRDIGKDKVLRSFIKKLNFSKYFFKEIIKIDNLNTIAFKIDQKRIINWLNSFSYAIYRNDFNKNYTGDWYIIDDASAIIIENNNYSSIDNEANIRNYIKSLTFENIKTDNPQVFKYAHCIDGVKILYKFIFYESIVYYSYTV